MLKLPNPDDIIMKENQEYVRKRRPINFTMEDLHEELEDDVFVSNTIPSTSRALPNRNSKPKNFHESDNENQDDTEEDESELEDMNSEENNVGKMENPPSEIEKYVI